MPIRRWLMPLLVFTILPFFEDPLHAANEPPIVAFEAMVDDNVLFTRRRETYPLVAVYRDKFVDLATVPRIGLLLSTYPGRTGATIEPKGRTCTEVPVMIGTEQGKPDASAFSQQNAPRRLSLVVLSTAAINAITSPVGVPFDNEDLFSSVRRTLADRFGGAVNSIGLQSYGSWDYDRDGTPETAMVGYAPGASEGVGRAAIVLANRGALTLPVYIYDLPENAQVMGMADLDGDNRAEIIIKTSASGRDFGIEIHSWRGRNMLKVFERRSYGCF